MIFSNYECLKTSRALSTACIHEEVIIILQGSKKDHEPTEIGDAKKNRFTMYNRDKTQK